jgi:uncharacterized membrane protein YdbT with pleckstrin-like domain
VKQLYSENPVMFKNNPIGFILSIVLVPAFGLGLVILLIWYLRCRSSKLTVTETDILFEQGLLSKDRSEIGFSSVRTVKVKQSFFNRIFGTGTIELYTAGDKAEIVASGMPDPNKIRDLIKLAQNGGT